MQPDTITYQMSDREAKIHQRMMRFAPEDVDQKKEAQKLAHKTEVQALLD